MVDVSYSSSGGNGDSLVPGGPPPADATRLPPAFCAGQRPWCIAVMAASALAAAEAATGLLCAACGGTEQTGFRVFAISIANEQLVQQHSDDRQCSDRSSFVDSLAIHSACLLAHWCAGMPSCMVWKLVPAPAALPVAAAARLPGRRVSRTAAAGPLCPFPAVLRLAGLQQRPAAPLPTAARSLTPAPAAPGMSQLP